MKSDLVHLSELAEKQSSFRFINYRDNFTHYIEESKEIDQLKQIENFFISLNESSSSFYSGMNQTNASYSNNFENIFNWSTADNIFVKQNLDIKWDPI